MSGDLDRSMQIKQIGVSANLEPSSGGMRATNYNVDSRRARQLEYFTIAWNALEAAVSVLAGYLAGSTALLGFGVDSAIESTSGAAVLWRFYREDHHDAREHIALRLVGASFLLLSAYVAIDAVRSLLLRQAPDGSVVGIAVASVSLIVMPVLARAKRRVGGRLKSRALEADSRQTSICAYLSAILLTGLALNAALGWWWADPVAALVMTPIIGHEGIEALRGDPCKPCR